MQINVLLKKKNALDLLAKLKKYEHEEDTYRHSLAVQYEKVKKQILAEINQRFSEIDAYLAGNLFVPDPKAVDTYSNYLSEIKQKELTLHSDAIDEVSFFLNKKFKSNKIKELVHEKSITCKKALQKLIELQQNFE